MRTRRRGTRRLALGLCAGVLAFAPGCQFLQKVLGAAGPLGARGGSLLPGFQSSGVGSPLSRIPNLLGGATPASPSSGVSPPASAASLQDFQQRYGFQVTGSAATPENLRRLGEACQYYDAGRHLQGLTSVELVDRGGPLSGTAGLWATNGRGANIRLYAFQEAGQPGHVINTHAAVHEIGHHVCELSRRQDFTPQLDRNIQASPQPLPTRYAGTAGAELRAETVATLLRGGVERPPGFLPSYQPAPALVQQVRAEFPRTSI